MLKKTATKRKKTTAKHRTDTADDTVKLKENWSCIERLVHEFVYIVTYCFDRPVG